ncbi:MAG: PQQ-binding-like beta-propeller repeat protein [Verrucomicrobiales bacterium]|nr:PQQ-binding-like beta-propeller repeat protein [Verrucomicrobiales bacterium]MCP5527269.1 PQQ-binding-like beta-propeller repeat protein [Verrucomicrobiales bacterium]
MRFQPRAAEPSPRRGRSLGLACLLPFATCAQENWPQFRGEGSRGVGESARLPMTWDRETNVAWRTPVDGRGWSSPVVWGNRIFLTTAVSEGPVEAAKKGLYFGGDRPEPPPHTHHWQVVCLDWNTGHVRWMREVAATRPSTPVHVKNTYASETPATDGEHVYALFGFLGLFCLDNAGEIVWSQPLTPRTMAHGWGTAASPVLHGDQVFVVSDSEEASFVAAYEKRTGREVWRVERDEASNWSTPFVWSHRLRTELVTAGRDRVRSYSLAGEVLWELPGLSVITIPTPFAADGLLYVGAGYVGDNRNPNKPVYAIKPGGSGNLVPADPDAPAPFIAWMAANAAPYNPSPLVYQGRFYVLWDFGFLSCRDAATGREIYDKQRIKPDGAAGFTASPWAANEHVFCLSEDGDTYVFGAGDDFRRVRVNPLGEMCMATPALARDSLIIRTLEAVYRIRETP